MEQTPATRAAGPAAAVLGLLISTLTVNAQIHAPTNWVIDPFCFNPNYVLTSANSSGPAFTNDGTNRGSLYGNSPIGATLTLVNPGDTISCTGQVTLAGDLNPNGDLQFRVGIFYQGTNTTDTNWLGYIFGNPTGDGTGPATGLFIRNNPNQGVYASGSAGNAFRPTCELRSYVKGWGAGAYDFSLSVTQVSPSAQQIGWKLTGVLPSAYSYSGSYTNTNALTAPLTFDQVGFLGGAALFNSASTSDTITFKNWTVTLVKKNVVR